MKKFSPLFLTDSSFYSAAELSEQKGARRPFLFMQSQGTVGARSGYLRENRTQKGTRNYGKRKIRSPRKRCGNRIDLCALFKLFNSCRKPRQAFIYAAVFIVSSRLYCFVVMPRPLNGRASSFSRQPSFFAIFGIKIRERCRKNRLNVRI